MTEARGSFLQQASIRAALTSFVLTASVVLGMTMVLGYPGFQDFGEWIYQGHVLEYALRGEVPQLAQFTDHPVPYTTSQVLLGACIALVGPITGAVVFWLLYALAGAAAVAMVVRRHDLPPIAASLFLTITVIIGSGFFQGYLGAQWGLVIVLAFLGLPTEVVTRWWMVLLLGLLTFFTHAIAFACWGLLALVYAVREGRFWSFVAAVSPSVAMVGWYVLASSGAHTGTLLFSGLVDWISYKGYTLAKFGGYHNLVARNQGDAELLPALYAAGVVANLLVALVIAAMVVVLVLRWKFLWARHRADSIAMLVMAIIVLALPAYVIGIVNPGERVMGYLLLVMTIRLMADPPRRAARVALVAPAMLGLLLTAVGMGLLPTKITHGGEILSTVPTAGDSRADSLFATRTDQFEDKVLATRDAPALPLTWNTSILVDPALTP